jgi:hypothetical protein
MWSTYVVCFLGVFEESEKCLGYLKKQKVEIEQLNKDVDSLTILSDSLSVELFPSQVELTRYQIAFELFVKRNPKAASQYGDIISQETE